MFVYMRFGCMYTRLGAAPTSGALFSLVQRWLLNEDENRLRQAALTDMKGPQPVGAPQGGPPF